MHTFDLGITIPIDRYADVRGGDRPIAKLIAGKRFRTNLNHTSAASLSKGDIPSF